MNTLRDFPIPKEKRWTYKKMLSPQRHCSKRESILLRKLLILQGISNFYLAGNLQKSFLRNLSGFFFHIYQLIFQKILLYYNNYNKANVTICMLDFDEMLSQFRECFQKMENNTETCRMRCHNLRKFPDLSDTKWIIHFSCCILSRYIK